MKNNMIRFFVLVLCVLFLLLSCETDTSETASDRTENNVTQTEQSEGRESVTDSLEERQSDISSDSESASERELSQSEKNALAKLTFYLGVKEYESVDRFSTLAEAIGEANAYAASYGLECLTLTVVIAGGDIGGDEGYREIMRERENCNTIEEVRAFREKLNSYSKEYHERLFQENISAFSVIEYTEIYHVGYSPWVKLTVPVDKLTEEALLALAESQSIGAITISDAEEAVDAETAMNE
ncbi:MAG: hypothetical protein IJY39_08270 [Clostridia bacterium]|nr:hypothetical protein [Clostridia bacterium]